MSMRSYQHTDIHLEMPPYDCNQRREGMLLQMMHPVGCHSIPLQSGQIVIPGEMSPSKHGTYFHAILTDLTMHWVLTSDSNTLDKTSLTPLFAQASTSVSTCIHFLSSCIKSLRRSWARLARYLFSDRIIFSLSECRATCPCASWHWVCWIEWWCCEFDELCN